MSLEKECQRGVGINHGSGMRIPEADSANGDKTRIPEADSANEDKTRNCVKKDGKQNSVTTTNYITLHYIILHYSAHSPLGLFSDRLHQVLRLLMLFT
jgi:hypothetical protein